MTEFKQHLLEEIDDLVRRIWLYPRDGYFWISAKHGKQYRHMSEASLHDIAECLEAKLTGGYCMSHRKRHSIVKSVANT